MGGFAVLSILLVNSGSTSCTLTGSPTVSVVGSSGTPALVSTPASGTTAFGTYAITTVSLSPGDAAQVFVAFDGGACPVGASVQVLLPGETSSIPFTQVPSSGICGSSLQVSPFLPSSVQVFSSYPLLPPPVVPISSAPACSSAALSGTQGQLIADGTKTDIEVILTNVSASTCSLDGRWPAVNILAGEPPFTVVATFTAWMPSYISTLGGSAQPDSSLTLSAQAAAVFFIEVPASTGTSGCAAPSGATISLPSGGASFPVALNVPALGVCSAESTATSPSVASTATPIYVTPISLASSPETPITGVVTPAGDGTGFYYGADSGGAPCEDYSPYQISYNGLTGGCGFFGGQMGGYWGLISGCSNSGWAWNSSQADSADHIYSGGVGTAGVYFLGGAGIDPNLVPGGLLDYTGGTPSQA